MIDAASARARVCACVRARSGSLPPNCVLTIVLAPVSKSSIAHCRFRIYSSSKNGRSRTATVTYSDFLIVSPSAVEIGEWPAMASRGKLFGGVS